MGAYANPEGYIDTQTAKSYQNLFETVAGVASDYAKTRRAQLDEQRKRMEANQLEVDKANLEIYSQLDKNTAVNKSVDWHEAYDPLVKEYGNINMSLLNGTVKDRSAAIKRLSQIRSSVDVSLDTITSTISGYDDFKKGVSQIGLPGGVSTIDNDLDTVNAYNVLTGKTTGKVHIKLDYANPSTQSLVVEGAVGGKSFTKPFDSTQINKAAVGNGIINYNYNTLEQDDATKITTGIYKAKVDKTGKATTVLDVISDQFLGEETLIPTKEKLPGREIYTINKKVNKPLITEKLAPQLSIQADGLLADKRAAAGTFHDVFKGPNDVDITAQSLLENKNGEQDIFRKAYLDYVVKSIPDTQPVLKDDGDIATYEDENAKTELERLKIETAKKRLANIGKTKGEKQPASAVKQAELNKRVTEIINNKEEGAGVKIGGYTFGLKDGRWQVYDSLGDPKPGTENETNPRILATQIGSTLLTPEGVERRALK